MAFRQRIGSISFGSLPHQCGRWYSSLISGARGSIDRSDGWSRVRVLENPSGTSSCFGPPGMQYGAVRFFAAPVQVKPKPDLKDKHGNRMNEAIEAEYVRLVTDEGHGILSRREALDRAKKLNLDLVEVQRTANPPVCKMMDFHREKYKRETKEKDRIKTKSELTLRKGACKEVRFSGKCEQKDLQMKAEMVKRLMERGYRVKNIILTEDLQTIGNQFHEMRKTVRPRGECTAMGTEEEDLGSLLLRLCALIEEFSFVESGPRVETRQAYVVVRHAKFGPSKKSSAKKVGKIVETIIHKVQGAASITPVVINHSSQHQVPPLSEELESIDSILETDDEVLSDEGESNGEFNDKMAWSELTVTDDFEKVFDIKADGSSTASSSTRSFDTPDVFSSLDAIDKTKPLQKFPPVYINGGSSLDQTIQASKTAVSSVKAKSEFQETERHIPTNPTASWSKPSTGSQGIGQQRPNQGRIPRQPLVDESRNRDQMAQKQEQTPPVVPSPTPGYGIFSAPKSIDSDNQRKMADGNMDKRKSLYNNSNNSDNLTKLEVEDSRQDNDKSKQGEWGLFSRESNSINQRSNSDSRKAQR